MTMPGYGNTTPDPEAASAFCQQCGQRLTAQTRRDVGGAVFCEPCLEAKLAGAARNSSSQAAGSAPAPLPSAPPKPRLAALLGFIPGVGAMYNEQYAKGIAHLAVFALLVVLCDANGIFSLFVIGWEFYMAIEAYHTAVARRDGMPLPNPFGFNDLGDRLGFARGWTHPGRPAPQSAYQTAAPPFSAAPPPTGAPAGEPAPNPWDGTASGAAAYTSPWTANAAFDSSFPPYTAVPPAGPAAPAQPACYTPLQRVPLAAIWLILLGLLFLLSTTGHFHEFSPEALVGWGLIGLSGWIFLVRLREPGRSFAAAGRLNHALQPSAWLFTSGLLAVLDGSRILSWGRSWPVFLITAGVLAMLRRLAPVVIPAPSNPVPPVSRPL